MNRTRSASQPGHFEGSGAPRTARLNTGKNLWDAIRRDFYTGSAVSALSIAILAVAMVPFRSHLSIATAALVLVIPVVVGVSVGGFPSGVIATILGFLVYDFVFIPPYYTLTVGAAQNWVAIVVYVAVMVVVARVFSQVIAARREAQQRAQEISTLFELSELLVTEADESSLLNAIVESVRATFSVEAVALLLERDAELELVASCGTAMTASEMQISSSPSHTTSTLIQSDEIQKIALTASGQPIGALIIKGLKSSWNTDEFLRAYINHFAVVLERSRLREAAIRTQLLERADLLRRSLVGAVSHDLRTPLATIKLSTSAILDPGTDLQSEGVRELVGLVEAQADRLDRLVANILDLTRIQAGALVLMKSATSLDELVVAATELVGISEERVTWSFPPNTPEVYVDPVLIIQVLANILDNAVRYSPDDSMVEVTSTMEEFGCLNVRVSDFGPGIPDDDRGSIFEMINRRGAGGRGGIGLAIVHGFLEVHNQTVWVEDGPDGRNSFCFTLPIADPDPREN